MVSSHPRKLSLNEVLSVWGIVVVVYMIMILGFLSMVTAHLRSTGNFSWGSDFGLWDHPEPNYAVLSYVAEFFCAITAAPFAGSLILYQCLRFDYGIRVLVLGLFDCWMYTGAFLSHSTLWPVLNAATLTSVVTNAIYTMVMFGGLAGGMMKNLGFRVVAGVGLWAGVLFCVRILPGYFGERSGGVPALTIIQTPGVFIATFGAIWASKLYKEGARRARTSSSSPVMMEQSFELLIRAGWILVAAMGVSFVEVALGEKLQPMFGKFPLFHVMVHTLEQIGIYLYGVGVAGLDCALHGSSSGVEERILWVGGWLPYLCRTVEVGQDTNGIRRMVTPENLVTEDTPIGQQQQRRSTRLRRNVLPSDE